MHHLHCQALFLCMISFNLTVSVSILIVFCYFKYIPRGCFQFLSFFKSFKCIICTTKSFFYTRSLSVSLFQFLCYFIFFSCDFFQFLSFLKFFKCNICTSFSLFLHTISFSVDISVSMLFHLLFLRLLSISLIFKNL